MTKLILSIFLAFALTGATPNIKKIASLGNMDVLKVSNNHLGDVVILVFDNTTNKPKLLLKKRNQQELALLMEEQALGGQVLATKEVGYFTVVNFNVGRDAIYLSTGLAGQMQTTAWKIPFNNGKPERVLEKDQLARVQVWNPTTKSHVQFNKKILSVGSLQEDQSGRLITGMTPEGYLGVFRLETDGSWKQEVVNGPNEMVNTGSGYNLSANAALFVSQRSVSLTLTRQDLTSKSSRPIVYVGSSIGGETVQNFLTKLSSDKKPTLQYFTTAGHGGVLEISGLGELKPLHIGEAGKGISQHATNLTNLFIIQGPANSPSLVTSENGQITEIAKFGEKLDGNIIKSFFYDSLAAYGCSLDFAVNTDAGPFLYTTSLPCILDAPDSFQGGTQVSLKGQNFTLGNPSKVEVEVAGLGVFPATVVSDSEVKFTTPNVNCVACATRMVLSYPSAQVKSNTVTTSVSVPTPKPSIKAITTAPGTVGAVAPGSLITLWGEYLAPNTYALNANFYVPNVTVVQSTPFPTQLGGTIVEIGGKAIPVNFSVCFEKIGCQINAQVPTDTPIGNVQVKVKRFADINGNRFDPGAVPSQSEVFTLRVQPTAPAVFNQPDGYPILQIFEQGYGLVSDITKPVANDTLVGYFTGGGKGIRNIEDGYPAGDVLTPLEATSEVTVTFTIQGNKTSQKVKAGSYKTGQFVGLDQFIFQLPFDFVPDKGTEVEFVLVVGGVEAQKITYIN